MATNVELELSRLWGEFKDLQRELARVKHPPGAGGVPPGGGGDLYKVTAVETNYLTCSKDGSGTFYICKPGQNRVSGDESWAVDDVIAVLEVGDTTIHGGDDQHMTLMVVSQGRAVFV